LIQQLGYFLEKRSEKARANKEQQAAQRRLWQLSKGVKAKLKREEQHIWDGSHGIRGLRAKGRGTGKDMGVSEDTMKDMKIT
jgi:hypothetical protein